MTQRVIGAWALRCAVVGTAALLALLTACPNEYDFDRAAPVRESFGAEVHRLVTRDAYRSRRDFRARGEMLEREKAPFVTALDAIVPEGWATLLDELLRRLLHLSDDGTLPRVSRRLAEVFSDLSANEALRADWERDNAGRFVGYRHPTAHAALLESTVGYPGLTAATNMLASVYLDFDGFNDDGTVASGEPLFMTDALGLLSKQLVGFEPDSDPDRIEVQLADILFTEDPRFHEEGAQNLWAVKFDHRGQPVVTARSDGSLQSPFVDRDGDGLADVDDQGRTVDFNGAPVSVPPFGEANDNSGVVDRDWLGRAVAGDDPVFEYTDLSQSVLAFLLVGQGDMIEANPEVLFDLGASLDLVLPERVSMVDEDGMAFMGYPASNLLLDLAYAALSMLAFPQLDEFFDVQAQLLREHGDVLAELVLSLNEFSDLVEANGDPELKPGNTLLDDLIPVLAAIASDRDLVVAILEAFDQPVTSITGLASLDLLDYKGKLAVPTAGGPYEVCFKTCNDNLSIGTLARAECLRACPSQEIFPQRVDRDQGPTLDNRSHFQRLVNLFADADDIAFEMVVTELVVPSLDFEYGLGTDVLPPLLRFDNASASMLDAVAGNMVLADNVTEAALASHEVELMVNGIDSMCSGSFVHELSAALIPRFVEITEEDFDRTCRRMDEVTNDTSVSDERRQRNRIAVTVTLLSLLTGVAFDERPTGAQLTRFFNLPDPSVDLDIATLHLGPLIVHDGYEGWEANADMLYAGEASGAIDALYPLIKAFSDRGKADLLVRLIATLHYHYAPQGTSYPRKDGSPSPNFGTGLYNYEWVIREWLAQDRLIPALGRLSSAAGSIQSARGTGFNDLVADLFARLMVPDGSVAHRDGTTTSFRNDGFVVEDLNRAYVLLDPLRALSDKFDREPAVKERWDRAVSGLFDSLLGVEDDGLGFARFVRPGAPFMSAIVMEHMADRTATFRDEGRLVEVVERDTLADVVDAMTGRGLPLIVDVTTAVDARPSDKEELTSLLLYNTEPNAVAALVIKVYELLLEMTDQPSFDLSADFYGRLIDPNRSWKEGGPPLGTDVMRMLRETSAADGEGVVPKLLRGALGRRSDLDAYDGDPAGGYPISELGKVIKDYHRVDPSSTEGLSAADYAILGDEVSEWILDDQHGVEQLYDMIDLRAK